MHDHNDAMARLSAREVVVVLGARLEDLQEAGLALFTSAVHDPARTFKERLGADVVGVVALRTFLGQPNVSRAVVWKQLPRGRRLRVCG